MTLAHLFSSIRKDLLEHMPPDTRSETARSKGVELKIVYRILRLISDLALVGFYSDVCVRGKEVVERSGPLILCPCHHNEILDIATLCKQTLSSLRETLTDFICSCYSPS